MHEIRLIVEPESHLACSSQGISLMKPLLIILFILPASLFAEEWTPPENPDPQTILNEAQSDALAKRYEIALAKHIWLHGW